MELHPPNLEKPVPLLTFAEAEKLEGYTQEKANQARNLPYFGFQLLVTHEQNWQNVLGRHKRILGNLWFINWYGIVAVLALVPTAYGAVRLAALDLIFPYKYRTRTVESFLLCPYWYSRSHCVYLWVSICQ